MAGTTASVVTSRCYILFLILSHLLGCFHTRCSCSFPQNDFVSVLCSFHGKKKKKKKLVNVIKFWNSFMVDGKKKKLVIWFLPRSRKNLRKYDCYCCCNFVVYLLMLSSPPKQDSRLIDRWWWWQQSLETIGKLFSVLLISLYSYCKYGRCLPRWIRVCARCTTVWWTTRSTGRSWRKFMNVRQQGR